LKTYGLNPLIHSVFRLCYTVLLCLLLPIILLLFKKKLHHSHPHLQHRSFWERFGKIDKSFKTGGIHVHCVSVGEINAAAGLIRALLEEYPSLPVTLTTSSTTGAAHAFEIFKNKVQHCYLPVDIPILMNRFYSIIQPTLVLVTEVEIWPNMVNACIKRNVPTVLINARMTSKSLKNYRKFWWLFRHTFRQFTVICAQSSESFENFLAFGVYKSRLKLSRNMKFDLLPQEKDKILGRKLIDDFGLKGRPILLAGSTHDPEEKLLLSTYTSLKRNHPDLALVIVPRHPHRFDEVYQIVKASGYCTERISSPNTNIDRSNVKGTIDCLLVDTMGWLKACYSVCSIAFVGGSFANKGGHNALEAALYSKPIVMGPSTFNNPNICQHLSSQNALHITQSEKELTEVIGKWLANPKQSSEDGEKGLQVLLRNAGSVEYTMGVLRSQLN
jgi:3-deoxy-D-manno-octulosonic-acid transferase